MSGEAPNVTVGQVLLGQGAGVRDMKVTAVHDQYVVARAMVRSDSSPSGFTIAWRNRIPLNMIGTDYIPSC